MTAENEFRLGPFSVGDLIAVCGILLIAGGMYANLLVVMKEQERQAVRLQALEQIVPSNYVQRTEYREDLREIRSLLEDIRGEFRQQQQPER